MKVTLAPAALASWFVISLATSLLAVEVGGGGSKTTDCLVTLDAAVNTPPTNPRHVRCVDGDPTCDSDGLVNGRCAFQLAVCANSTFSPSCSLNGVQSITIDNAIDNGDPKFDPAFQALQTAVDSDLQPPSNLVDDCTTATEILVPIKGPYGNNRCGASRKKVVLTALSQVISGKIHRDRDKMKFTCIPDPNGCDPTVLFSGTFDRIQRQVFNQSCALSGCHDSQTQAATLLLETGASYGELVNATPANFSAFGAGWLRVDAPNPPGTSGNTETSLLFRKITGDLPDPLFGSRMPLNKPKLNKTLRDVIELWIEAGAPATGWVSGTD
jgi:hypothetical protein